jgi:hypothetical protein
MLERVRKDRPNQVIHEVFGFKENEYGFYDVKVDMELESPYFCTKILHHKCILPYPVSKYLEMDEQLQIKYRLNITWDF